MKKIMMVIIAILILQIGERAITEATAINTSTVNTSTVNTRTVNTSTVNSGSDNTDLVNISSVNTSPINTGFVNCSSINNSSDNTTSVNTSLNNTTLNNISLMNTDAIDIYLQEKMKEAAISCLSLGIVKDGETLYYNSYSDNPRSLSNKTENLFPIGSISKTFTALAVRQLINSGRIHETDPVSDYISGFSTSYQGKEATVTIGQLLSHTSGISKVAGGEPYLYNRSYSLGQITKKSMEIVLVHRPGEVYEYSNMNYIILGRIIEIITGWQYKEYIREYILEPLGMKNTFSDVAQLQGKEYHQGYLPFYGVNIPAFYPFSGGNAPSGGIFSNVEDMCKWMSLYQKGGYFNDISLIENNPISPMGSERICYDIYWVPMYKTKNLTINHDGSYPGYSSSMVMDASSEYGIVILTNSFDQMGVFSKAPTPWSMTEEVLTYLNTGTFPEQTKVVWNYRPLIWLFFLMVAMIALSIFVLLRDMKRKGEMKRLQKLIGSLIHFIVPVLWVILIPIMYDISWRWLLVSNPLINVSILFVITVLFLSGIVRIIILLRKRNIRIPNVHSKSS